MKLINLPKFDLFSNKIPDCTDTYVSSWHSLYIHCSGRSNFLPHGQPFSTVSRANLYLQADSENPGHSKGIM